MRPDPRFLLQPPEFWAYVRTIGQEVGYTESGRRKIKAPTLAEVRAAFDRLGLSVAQIESSVDRPTTFGATLFAYFAFRAEVLNEAVASSLMDKDEAEKEFRRLRRRLRPRCPLPMNKQKGDKRNHAFVTGIVNMLVEAGVGGAPCDFDPRGLTTVTRDGRPVRTLARRVEGAFPSVVDPIAIWEIKEYYYTTTFGSRVADGVYETLLDGMELRELEAATGRRIDHVLFVDARSTWWDCGRSYLCRLIDMLHMGLVDEVIFGREVLTRLPDLVSGWAARYWALHPGRDL